MMISRAMNGQTQRVLAASRQPPAPNLQDLAASPRASARDTPELRATFNDFVGQTFFGELLKQMRATVDKPAFFDGGMGEEVFQSQLDQILVERISDATASSFSDPMYQLMMAHRG